MKSEVIIVGGGGHALTVWDILASHDLFVPLGYTDENKSLPLQKLNAKYLGFDSEVGHLASIGVQFVLGIGQVKTPNLRINAYKNFSNLGFSSPTVVSHRAYASTFFRDWRWFNSLQSCDHQCWRKNWNTHYYKHGLGDRTWRKHW